MKILLTHVLFFSLTIVIHAQQRNLSKWPHAITYEIYVQSFADSNGDGKGDINGLTSKLDYLKDLGVEAVWLMPIHPSNTYHKYNVHDYYGIDPDYGTLEDFKRFVNEAHKKNIKVVIDLVINHAGRMSSWFQQALKDSTSPYWNYFVWAHKDDPQTKSAGNVTGGETRRRNRWKKVDGTDYMFYAQFSENMPDLNFDNPKVREEIFKIGRFWAEEVKVDGFRLDAAKHIYPDERVKEGHLWWEYFLQEMRKVNKDFYLVGEVWASPDIVAPYLKGIPALMNFEMASVIIKAVNTGVGDSVAIKHKAIRDAYKAINPEFIDATFLSNHDQNRIMSAVNDDEAKARLAAAILMTLPGSPYLYYGEEIGMKGKKPDEFIREPFIWDIRQDDKIRTKWEQPRFSTDTSMTPAQLQMKNDNSLWNYYRSLIKLRNKSKALTYAEIIPVNVNNPAVLAFGRAFEDESVFVIHNVSNTSQTITVPSQWKEYRRELYKSKPLDRNENQLTLDAYGSYIFRSNN